MTDIVGTAGNDSLAGTSATDTISGLGGNDSLYDDGGGNDTINGGDGDDTIGVYRSNGPASIVTLLGGAGNDYLNAAGVDLTVTLSGGTGNDEIVVLAGANATIDAGDGDDRVILIMPAGATITLGTGSDRLMLFQQAGTTLPPATYIITDFATGAGGDVLSFIYPNTGENWLDGVLVGWDQSNPWGSGGFLRAFQSGADTLIQIDRDGGANSWTTLFVLSGVIATTLTAFNLDGYPADGTPPAGITIDGTALGDNLYGTIGNDIINGLDGNDFILGGAGPDTIFGGNGDDILIGGAQIDTIHGDDGNDNIQVYSGDTGWGGNGDDGLQALDDGFNNGVYALNGDAGADRFQILLDGTRNQSAIASGGADNDYFSLFGGAASTLDGDDGDDVFEIVRAAADGSATVNINGGGGMDSFIYTGDHAGQINFNGGTGADRISLSSNIGAIQIALGSGQDIVDFAAGFNAAFSSRTITFIDFAAGNNGDRIFFIPWLDQVLTNWDHTTNPFSTGHIRVRNSAGNALVEIDRDGGGNSYQLFLTLQGNTAGSLTAYNFHGYAPNGSTSAGVTINGTPNADTLTGGTGGDTINGLDGDDTVFAGPGNDQINGGTGFEDIHGEGGNDTIIFENGGASGGFGNDTITMTGVGGGMNGGSGDDILTANGGTADITGGAGLDTIFGSTANDYIYVEDSDIIDGRGGGDIVYFDLRNATVGMTVDLTPLATGGVGTLGAGTIRNIGSIGQEFQATAFNDTILLGTVGNFGSGIEVFAGAGDDSVTGSQNNDTLWGNAGNDILVGADGNDQIDGGDGSDTASGGAGNDIISDLVGNNILNGNDGDDLLASGSGNDQINGGVGIDQIDGGLGIDILRGGADNDRITVRGEGSSVFGDDGSDVISLLTRANVDGGAGQDVLAIDLTTFSSGVSLNLSNLWTGGNIAFGASTISSIEIVASHITLTEFDDILVSGASSIGFGVNALGGNDVVIGTGVVDVLDGDEGNDVLVGGGGDDRLAGGLGNNELIGGLGDDIYTVSSSTDSVVEFAGQGIDHVNTSLASYTLPTFVENLSAQGNVTGFVGIGNDLDNRISGTDFADTLVGGAGNDQLFGAGFITLWADILIGGSGNDYYYVSNEATSVVEYASEGIDSVETILGYHALAANVENLTYTFNGDFIGLGNNGDNVINSSGGNDTLHGFEGNDALNGGAGIDILLGGDGDDRLNGSFGQDQIYGGAGNDTLSGGVAGGGPSGSNYENALYGGTGNDLYIVEVRGDSTIEFAGEGIDEVQTTFSIYGLQANIENLTFTDNAAHLAGVGNELSNVIRGSTGRDELFGREGNDMLIGGSGTANALYGQEGDDSYFVTAIGDSVIEFTGQGTDWVIASVASFTLGSNVENLRFDGVGTFIGVGNDDANQITGGAGADSLNGLDGNDILAGLSGADILLGGAGQDEFRYFGNETGIDRILDFVSGSDRIELSLSGFVKTALVDFVAGAGAMATSSNSTILYDTDTGIISYDADGNGNGAAVQLAQLNLGQTVVAGDFVFI
jgi:Ca2+-binding RTX toxin-like protein